MEFFLDCISNKIKQRKAWGEKLISWTKPVFLSRMSARPIEVDSDETLVNWWCLLNKLEKCICCRCFSWDHKVLWWIICMSTWWWQWWRLQNLPKKKFPMNSTTEEWAISPWHYRPISNLIIIRSEHEDPFKVSNLKITRIEWMFTLTTTFRRLGRVKPANLWNWYTKQANTHNASRKITISKRFFLKFLFSKWLSNKVWDDRKNPSSSSRFGFYLRWNSIYEKFFLFKGFYVFSRSS